MWGLILGGSSCAAVGDLPQYVGSTTSEFLSLPIAKQRRLLKKEGICKCSLPDGKSADCGCIVPINDSRAKADSYIFFPYSWAGRNGMNFVKADKNKKVNKGWE
jgi:hypothetical protein